LDLPLRICSCGLELSKRSTLMISCEYYPFSISFFVGLFDPLNFSVFYLSIWIFQAFSCRSVSSSSPFSSVFLRFFSFPSFFFSPNEHVIRPAQPIVFFLRPLAIAMRFFLAALSQNNSLRSWPSQSSGSLLSCLYSVLVQIFVSS